MTVSVDIETGATRTSVGHSNDALTNIQKDTAQVRLLRDGKVQRQKISRLRGLAMFEVVSVS